MELAEAVELHEKVAAALNDLTNGTGSLTSGSLSGAEAALHRALVLTSELVGDLEAAGKLAEGTSNSDLAFLAGQIHARLIDDDRTRRAFFSLEFRDGFLVVHPFTVSGSYRLRLERIPDEERF